MKRFLIALQFLTIIPIKINSEVEDKDLGASLIYFPMVGALIGLLLALCTLVFGFLPRLVIVALVIIVSIIVTGVIHIDGLADTCDGLFSFKSKEKMLEVMRDSRIGAMGMTAIACVLLFKFTLLFSLPIGILGKSLILMIAFSRWAQVVACYSSKYARNEGRAKYYIEYAGGREVIGATLFTLTLFFVLMQLKGIVLFFLSMLPIFLFINFVKSKIGGMTGDTIGATSELAEVILVFFILIGLLS
jgi:adenosylcobinamide-GDP ribazoletransferase